MNKREDSPNPTENPPNTEENTPIDNDGDKNKSELKPKIIRIAVWLGVATCVVFFILPTLFILLGAMWPNCFSGIAALESLNANINSAVGIAGLVLAVFSIWYAFETNKMMDKQQAANEAFLNKLDVKIEQIKSGVDDVSERSNVIFDQIQNMRGEQPRSSEEAGEQY